MVFEFLLYCIKITSKKIFRDRDKYQSTNNFFSYERKKKIKINFFSILHYKLQNFLLGLLFFCFETADSQQ